MDDRDWKSGPFKGAYESHFQRLNPLDRETFDRWVASYRRMYERFMPREKDTRILDLACGAGHFLHFLAQMGYSNHLGVDRSEEFIAFIRENITPNVLNMDAFEFLKDHGDKFDLVVINDFLEHIPKEKLEKFLDSVRNICNSEGKLIIKTINMTFPLAGWSRYMDFTHEVGFTEESIEYLLQLSGFHDIMVHPAEPDGINKILRLGMLPLLRIAGRNTRKIVTPNLLALGKA